MDTFTLDNEILKAVFLTYGATLGELWIKDRNRNSIDVIQGLQKPEDVEITVEKLLDDTENPIRKLPEIDDDFYSIIKNIPCIMNWKPM